MHTTPPILFETDETLAQIVRRAADALDLLDGAIQALITSDLGEELPAAVQHLYRTTVSGIREDLLFVADVLQPGGPGA